MLWTWRIVVDLKKPVEVAVPPPFQPSPAVTSALSSIHVHPIVLRFSNKNYLHEPQRQHTHPYIHSRRNILNTPLSAFAAHGFRTAFHPERLIQHVQAAARYLWLWRRRGKPRRLRIFLGGDPQTPARPLREGMHAREREVAAEVDATVCKRAQLRHQNLLRLRKIHPIWLHRAVEMLPARARGADAAHRDADPSLPLPLMRSCSLIPRTHRLLRQPQGDLLDGSVPGKPGTKVPTRLLPCPFRRRWNRTIMQLWHLQRKTRPS
jgi:hypothetical protein